MSKIVKAIEWFNEISSQRRFVICLAVSVAAIVLCEIYCYYKQRTRK